MEAIEVGGFWRKLLLHVGTVPSVVKIGWRLEARGVHQFMIQLQEGEGREGGKGGEEGGEGREEGRGEEGGEGGREEGGGREGRKEEGGEEMEVYREESNYYSHTNSGFMYSSR